MLKLQSCLPPAMKDLAKFNHPNFAVITIAFDRIRIRILNPFCERDLRGATRAQLTQGAAIKRNGASLS